jgi:hypothetical protein
LNRKMNIKSFGFKISTGDKKSWNISMKVF